MSETSTKGMVRNIHFNGSVFFILLFPVLTYHTEKILLEYTNEAAMSAAVVRDRLVWEQSNYAGCRILLGEGAYFAPGLGNVVGRRDGEKNFNALLQAWMKIQPLNAPGRRAIPQFHLSEGQVNDLAELLKRSSKIDTNQRPPNKEGW